MSVKKHIPNAITCCNLFPGCVACVMAFKGAFDLAMGFIVLGAVFDFFDGMVARLLRVSSPLGVQMDSLADDITSTEPDFIAQSWMPLSIDWLKRNFSGVEPGHREDRKVYNDGDLDGFVIS